MRERNDIDTIFSHPL